MTGGALGDGLYRMEFGQDDAQAMLIQGKSVLWVREPWVNRLGTWKVESGRLVISLERRCTPTQDEADTETLHLAFGFKGNVLYTQELDFEDMPVLAWRKVESLCEENDSFTCRVTPCACEFVTNKPLSGQSRCR
ncbi:hypothetical protein [Corallococcus sp. RDP092CA]|uniref:hypothetical protein n=1 Tax=Corallococcus sp. RDP092CA TaxID=3109369 RepID=UPI0035AFD5B1